MADLELPDLPQPASLPHYMMGATSPLWAYFGTAAAGGVAFWWMTRWARPVKLEALFGEAATVAEPVLEAVAPVLEVVEAVAETPLAVAEVLAEPAPALEPVVESAPELAAKSDAPVEAVAESTPGPKPAPTPRVKKAGRPVSVADEA